MNPEYIFKPNTRYEILTPTGFQPFGGMRTLSKSSHYKLTLSNGSTLKCSRTHTFISNGNEVKADDIFNGQQIDSNDGEIFVIDKTLIKSDISLYDIVEVSNGNIFIADGVVSHNCDFVTSGDNVIDPNILTFYNESFVQEPLEKGGFDGNLWKWEYPNYNKTYLVAADVARGDGADFSTAQVIDVETLSQVAEYRGKLDTKDFGNFLVTLATEYNQALLVVENSNIGWATIQQIIDRDYSNLFYMSKDLKYVDTEKHITNKYYAEERSMVAGFSTTARTRPLIISKLDEYMRDKSVIIRSIRLIDELFTFNWVNGKAQAMRGYNDDLVMSFSIGLWVRDTALRLRQEGVEIMRKAVSGIQSHTYSGVYGGTNQSDNPWSMRVGDHDEDLRIWLK